MNDSLGTGATARTDAAEREDSGLEDILAVAKALKESEDSDLDFGSSSLVVGGDDDEDVLGNLSAGFGSSAAVALVEQDLDVEPAPAADSTPVTSDQDGSARVAPAGVAAAAEKNQAASPERRSPLVPIAVIAIVALGGIALVLAQGPGPKPPERGGQEEALVAAAGASADRRIEARPAGEFADPTVEPDDPTAGVGGGLELEEAVLGAETGALANGEEDVDSADADAEVEDSSEPEEAARSEGMHGSKHGKKSKQGGSDAGTKDEAATDEKSADERDPPPDEAPDDAEPDPQVPAEGEDQEDPKPPKADDSDVDCLLNPNLPKCQSGKKKQDEVKKQDGPALPERLDSIALRKGFGTVKAKAKACGKDHGAEPGAKVSLHATIEGATGKVTKVQIKGEHSGSDLGKCVENVVMGATFDKFSRPAMGSDYSIRM